MTGLSSSSDDKSWFFLASAANFFLISFCGDEIEVSLVLSAGTGVLVLVLTHLVPVSTVDTMGLQDISGGDTTQALELGLLILILLSGSTVVTDLSGPESVSAGLSENFQYSVT